MFSFGSFKSTIEPVLSGVRRKGQVNYKKILIVENSSCDMAHLAHLLKDEGFCAVLASSYEEALKLAQESEPGLALLERGGGDNSTSRFISDLKELSPDWECVLADEANIETGDASSIHTEEVVSAIRNAFLAIQNREKYREFKHLLNNSDAYLFSLLDIIEDAIFVKDREQKFLFINSAFRQWFGIYDDVSGCRNEDFGLAFLSEGEESQNCSSNIPQLMKKRNVIDRRGAIPVYYELAENCILDKCGVFLGVVGVIRNGSDKKILQEKLIQAQKMEAMGALAGGIAHDFNNILGAIVGYVELARMDSPEGSPDRTHLTEVLRAAQRASDLIKQILRFSRHSIVKTEPVKVSQIIEECLQLIRASLPSSIEIIPFIKHSSGVALIDATQMHQVMMNLASNAGHAMCENGGKLYVTVENITLEGENIPTANGLPPGEYIRITVRDTGHGMSEATVRHIFDPYFTTKDEGIGTGLGLAVVKNIILAASGAVTVESELGKGSSFYIYIPRVNDEAKENSNNVQPAPIGHERILYVDDEGMLADIGKKMFEKLGYEVTAETNPKLALDIFEANPYKFDLVVTDQTMPGLTGVELARRILKIRQNIPVVICSGFTEPPEYQEAGRLGIKYFLRKPIVMKEFAYVIRKALDESHQEQNGT